MWLTCVWSAYGYSNIWLSEYKIRISLNLTNIICSSWVEVCSCGLATVLTSLGLWRNSAALSLVSMDDAMGSRSITILSSLSVDSKHRLVECNFHVLCSGRDGGGCFQDRVDLRLSFRKAYNQFHKRHFVEWMACVKAARGRCRLDFHRMLQPPSSYLRPCSSQNQLTWGILFQKWEYFKVSNLWTEFLGYEDTRLPVWSEQSDFLTIFQLIWSKKDTLSGHRRDSTPKSCAESGEIKNSQ